MRGTASVNILPLFPNPQRSGDQRLVELKVNHPSLSMVTGPWGDSDNARGDG